MKQRKFPIVLVTVAVILVGGVGVLNARATKTATSTTQEQLEEEFRSQVAARPEPPKSTAAPSKEDIAKQVKQAAETGGATPGRPSGGPGGPGREDPNAPKILIPERAPYKPVPNESATSSQWFK